MQPDSRTDGVRSQALWMLLAAALFGYFGFFMGWSQRYTPDQPPQLLMMVVALMWSLRIGAIAFATAGVIALSGSPLGLLIYALAGITTALVFAIVSVWDWTTQDYFSGINPLLLIIFAAWNGLSAVQALNDWRRSSSSQS